VARLHPLQPELADGFDPSAVRVRAATFDHVAPHAHGGTDDSSSNLVTACWSCNLQKSEFTLERIGWHLQDQDPTIEWDGLVHAYPALWALANARASSGDRAFHGRWLRFLCA
jgi:hypothetical protein